MNESFWDAQNVEIEACAIFEHLPDRAKFAGRAFLLGDLNFYGSGKKCSEFAHGSISTFWVSQQVSFTALESWRRQVSF